MNREFLKDFCRDFDYPDDAFKALSHAADVVESDKIALEVMDGEINRYVTGEPLFLHTSHKKIKTMAEPLDVETGTVEMLFFIFAAEYLKEIYIQKGYTETMYHDAMTDLRCKIFECNNVKGFWGSFQMPFVDAFPVP